jgi:hypothetical protein
LPAVPIDQTTMIEAARGFADHHDRQGRPRNAWLRRSISTSYYALFHCIVRQVAQHLLPNGSVADQLRLTRSFDHREIKAVCGWIAGRATAPQHAQPIIDRLSGTALADVCAAFLDLQEARHMADYDHLAPISKATALSYLQDAEQAIRRLAGLRPGDREAFFALLALQTKLK